jgi:probable O-glycosylation ligase (exosortase A-associated)
MHRMGERYQLAMILAIPAIIVALMILKNPFNGVFFYFIYDFLRPYDFIPALRPLRLAIVIEVLTLVSWIIYMATKKRRIIFGQFGWLYFLWLSMMALSVFSAQNNHLAYNILQGMTVTFLMFVISTNVVDTKKRLMKIIWLLILVDLYFAIYGIFNYAVLHYSPGTHYQTSGTVGSSFLGDENDFAMVINTIIPLAFFMLGFSKNRYMKIFSVGMLLIFMLAVIMSFSRGGWMGFVSIMIFCVLKSERKLASIAYMLIIGIVFVTVAPPSYYQRLQTISQTGEGSAAARIRYWKAGLRMFAAYPIFGVGPANGGIHMPEFIKGIPNPEREWGRAFHGLFPQIMAELGSAGLLLYLAMIFFIVRSLRLILRRSGNSDDDYYNRFVANSILGSLLGFFVCSIFLSTAYYPQLWTFYTLVIMLMNILYIRERNNSGAKSVELQEAVT